MGCEVNITLNGLLATLPHIRPGKLKALVMAGLKRSEPLPDAQTLNEAVGPDFSRARGKGS